MRGIMRDVCYNNIEKYILYYFLLIYIFIFISIQHPAIYRVTNHNYIPRCPTTHPRSPYHTCLEFLLDSFQNKT